MNFLKRFVTECAIEYQKARTKRSHLPLSQIKKKVREVEVELAQELSELVYLMIGVTAATFGLKGFLLPNGFLDGGVTGVSLLVESLTGIPLPILIFFINLPFLIIAYFAVGKRFAIKSIMGIVLLAVSLFFIPFTAITDDPILIATFGGLFLGLGIGLAIRGGAIIDGTEVLAIYISRKTSLTVGNVILLFNLVIFMTAAYIISVETALYAILTYFAASKTVDFVIDGIEEFMGITIISDKNEDIRLAIIEGMGRGCTVFKAAKGFSKRGVPLVATDVVYTVITRLELSKLKSEVYKIDRDAFIIMTSVKDAKGGMIKKKPIKKFEQ